MTEPIDFVRRRRERDDELRSGTLPLSTFFGPRPARAAATMRVDEVAASYLKDCGIEVHAILRVLSIAPETLIGDLTETERDQLTYGIEGTRGSTLSDL